MCETIRIEKNIEEKRIGGVFNLNRLAMQQAALTIIIIK